MTDPTMYAAADSESEDATVSRKRVLLADDHAAMLEEVRALLGDAYEVVGAVENGEKLVEAASMLRPDVIVSDISMPVMTGFEAAARIRELGIPSRIIFLTVQSSTAYLKKARSLGADGYVLKIYTNEELPLAIASVLSGTPYFSPQLRTGSPNSATGSQTVLLAFLLSQLISPQQNCAFPVCSSVVTADPKN